MTLNLKQNLSRYIDACFPILYINTFEESKTEDLLNQIADRRRIIKWSSAEGYSEFSTKTNEFEVPPTKKPFGELLDVLLASPNDLHRTFFVIKDAHIILENQEYLLGLKEIALRISNGLDSHIVLISPVVKIPVELEKYITILESDYQGYDEIYKIIKEFISYNKLDYVNEKLIEEMAVAFKGLSEFEIGNILALAVAEDSELTRKDLQLIFEQKKQMILKSGILEMIPLKESIKDIGGLENLKSWLERKAQVIKNINKAESFGVDMPKGVLICGVPGCGKSLCAKAAANLFEVPLLRLDIGKLMGKYLGESEANMRKAINLAEAISPCVLWIDELEKAFAGMGSDGGHEVTTRLFGSFLTWMQEKTGTAFVVATANDITKLPPELLRKGRFDEIFYVGLPNDSERRKILEIHIGKRREADLIKINLNELVEKTNGYSGADIEGVVKDGVEYAFTNNKSELVTTDILTAIRDTHSLSEIMKEPLEKMKKEYETRKFKNASR
jgi:SpoVK/Ycf46/Vps4 family AAA+-type ATPase